MSTIKADAIEAATGIDTDLVLTGKGTGVPDLQAGTKLNGVALTTAFLSPTGDGSGLSGVGGGMQSMQVFTASGTWTKPAGITKVKVTVIGGGAGGTSGANGTMAGGGGGAGGTSIKFIDVSAISSETVTVGAGGAGATGHNTLATTGGTSSFGAHCSATGGGTSSGNQYGDGGAGGNGSGGDINIQGGSGDFDATQQANFAINRQSKGGPSFLSQPEQSRLTSPLSASGYGGGGNGTNRSGGSVGGAGSGGIVIVEEYA